MKSRIGQFNAAVTFTDGQGGKGEIKVSFAGYEWEQSVAEFCEMLVCQTSELIRFVKTVLKGMAIVRKEAPQWVECFNLCAQLVREAESTSARKSPENSRRN